MDNRVIAEYDEKIYNLATRNGKMFLVTYQPEKADDTWRPERSYFVKEITEDDEKLKKIKRLHFSVNYKDREIQSCFNWNVDEDNPCAEKANIENNEVSIQTFTNKELNTWQSCGPRKWSKIIRLHNCRSFYIEEEIWYENGEFFSYPLKRVNKTSEEDFKKQLINYRRENI